MNPRSNLHVIYHSVGATNEIFKKLRHCVMTHASDAWVNGNLVIKSYRQNPLVNFFLKTHGTHCITLYCRDQLLTPTNVSLLFSLSLPLLFISSSHLLTSFHRLFFLFFFIFLSDSSHRCFFSLLSHYYSNNNLLYFSHPPLLT